MCKDSVNIYVHWFLTIAKMSIWESLVYTGLMCKDPVNIHDHWFLTIAKMSIWESLVYTGLI